MFIKNYIYGLVLGIGFIIPGVSGGVIATILGIYEEIIDKLLNLFKNKNNFLYIIYLFLGIFTSVIFLSKIILYLLENKLYFISYVFIGLILGCVPYLFQEIKKKTNKSISIISFAISLLFGIFLYIIQKNNLIGNENINTLSLIIAGILYAIGKIVPGISGAALLMLIGIYKYFLNYIANPSLINLNVIITFIPFLLSFIISSIFILKLISYLLNNYFRLTYSAIIGFVISSILFIYPNYFSLPSLIIVTLAFNISYYLSSK